MSSGDWRIKKNLISCNKRFSKQMRGNPKLMINAGHVDSIVMVLGPEIIPTTFNRCGLREESENNKK